MSLLEEETWKNKQIQAGIAETAKRQSEALAKRRTAKATAAAIVRKALRPSSGRRGGRGGTRRRSSRRELSPLEDESDYFMEKDAPAEPRRTSTRKRQRPVTFDSSISGSIGEESNESEDEEVDDADAAADAAAHDEQRQAAATPATGNGDAMVSWARAGTRSRNVAGGAANNTRHLRCVRATVLLESLTGTAYKDISELDVQFSLMPMIDDANLANNLPSLERPHLCCSPKLSIQQVCSFIMSHDLFPVDTELEIVAEYDSRDPVVREKLQSKETTALSSGKKVEILDMNATLGDVYTAYWNRYNNLSLLYRRKCQ